MRLGKVLPVVAFLVTTGSFPIQASELEAQSLQRAQRELVLQLEQLREETQSLRGLIEELSFQIREMSGEQKERYLDLDERLGELVRVQRESAATWSERSATGGSNPVAAVPPVSTVAIREPAPSVQPSQSEQEAYNSAFALVRDKKFDESLIDLARFIETYPNSPLALDARFWRGQVFDVQGQDIQAIEEFRRLSLIAPDYRRILQVKEKLGKLLIRNQDLVNGRKFLEEVIEAAPSSVEAGLAQRELDALN